MRLAGRVSAAIDVLTEIFERHRPASEALKDWGKAHRFAGSTDRHAIGTLVYDALRRRNSLALPHGRATRRAPWRWPACAMSGASPPMPSRAMAEEQHGPGALTAEERAALCRDLPADLPVACRRRRAGVAGAILREGLRPPRGGGGRSTGAARAGRPPRQHAEGRRARRCSTALARFGAVEGPWSPLAVRIPAPGPDTRNANVEVEPAHGLGWFEVQDAGSQVAALLSGAEPGMQRRRHLCRCRRQDAGARRA